MESERDGKKVPGKKHLWTHKKKYMKVPMGSNLPGWFFIIIPIPA